MDNPSIEAGLAERASVDQAWARWLARGVDALFIIAISYGAWYAIGVYWSASIEFGWLNATSLDWALSPTLQMKIADLAMFILLVLIIEPFFIGLAGATPGKMLMGVRVVKANGQKLGYGGALARSFMVLSFGLAFFIPVASFLTMLLQFWRVSNGNPAAWDEFLGSRVVHVKRLPVLWLALIVVVLGVRLISRWDDISSRLSQ